MSRAILRAILVALFGALIGPACLVLVSALHPQIELPIYRLPPNATGFYPEERDGDRWFVWTRATADVRMAGLDRRAPWTCTVQLRGARPPGITQPEVSLAIDGVPVVTRRATNEFQPISVTAPARGRQSGLLLSVRSSETFVPGPGDRRTLGVQVNEIGCRPAAGALVLPPHHALATAALASAALGAGLGLTGITGGSAIGGTALLALGQAIPLTARGAQYTPFPDTMVSLAWWIALLLVAFVALARVVNRQPLRNTARFAVIFSGGALYLQLLALLHPAKAIVDALFHAHRFESVLAGRWYFTQLSTSATPFPYAIGLYLFAAPWSVVAHNHVALLRIVVSAAQAVAGALLYVMVVRWSRDRLASAIAAGLFALVPASYVIVGNANLTNAFGASVAIVTVIAASVWPLDRRSPWHLVALVALATLAFISHVSTVVVLLATLAVMVLLYFLFGRKEWNASAALLALCTALALVLSVAVYWGHFTDVYKAQIARMRAPAALSSQAQPSAPVGDARPAAVGRTRLSLGARVRMAFDQTVVNLGWPILLLSLLGAWQCWRTRERDRLRIGVLAWLAVCVGLVLMATVAPGAMRYQQDAYEFIARVEQATSPGFVILAAIGAAWAWRTHLAARLAASALVVAALLQSLSMWKAWV